MMGINEHLFPEERRQEILKRVNLDGRVEVNDLSQLFGVSEVTIRSDLQLLSDQSLVLRTHGGAVPLSRIPELSLSLRRQQQVNQKNRIGAAGAGMVEDGDAIFLDTSSTALALAHHLRERRDITIITNSLAIAQFLLDVPNATVVMPGGTLQRETVSLVGIDGLDFLRKFNIRKGFFGAHGIRQPEGLTDVSATEAEVKRALITQCHEVIAILDSTKWGRIGLASFARLEDIHAIITDTGASPEQVEQVRMRGIRVILV
jgi:DeoR/GlpR family transcriptional regulator of sugar metabolism